MPDKEKIDQSLCKRFVHCERGATGIEYAMIASAVFLGLAPLFSTIGDSLLSKYQSIGNLF